jgi:hypothetical protein
VAPDEGEVLTVPGAGDDVYDCEVASGRGEEMGAGDLGIDRAQEELPTGGRPWQVA